MLVCSFESRTDQPIYHSHTTHQDVIYPFSGPSYGTTATCKAQGLAYLIGTAFILFMNGVLNIYYLCSLRYEMKEATFRKCVEPILYSISIFFSVFLPALLSSNIGINPTPYESYCSAGFYPWQCNQLDDVECINGGNKEPKDILQPLVFVGIAMGFSSLATSMFLIILTFYSSERKLKRTRRLLQQQSNPSEISTTRTQDEHDAQESQYYLTKIITRQALMYIGAFLLTWIFTFLSFFKQDERWIQALKLVFQPLQGFFNFFIFLFHKVTTICRSDEDVNISEALQIIFTCPKDIPDVLISRLVMVHEDSYKNKYGEKSSGHQVDISLPADNLSAINSDGLVNFADEAGLPAANDKFEDDHWSINGMALAIENTTSTGRTISASLISAGGKEEDGFNSQISREDDAFSYPSTSRSLGSGFSMSQHDDDDTNTI